MTMTATMTMLRTEVFDVLRMVGVELFEILRWVGIVVARSFLWGAILYVNRREIAMALLWATNEVREFVLATDVFWMLD